MYSCMQIIKCRASRGGLLARGLKSLQNIEIFKMYYCRWYLAEYDVTEYDFEMTKDGANSNTEVKMTDHEDSTTVPEEPIRKQDRTTVLEEPIRKNIPSSSSSDCKEIDKKEIEVYNYTMHVYYYYAIVLWCLFQRYYNNISLPRYLFA